MRAVRLLAAALLMVGCFAHRNTAPVGRAVTEPSPFVIVLGVAQDGGVPQAGSKEHPGWEDTGARRHATCLGIVDPRSSERWLVEATPDFREQLHRLDTAAPVAGVPGLAGILLTHAHMGHYTGLVHLGHEAIGAQAVPVYAMPRMRKFLTGNGPWNQLVRYGNIELRTLADGVVTSLNKRISVAPFEVPHRQEYSEVVGFRIEGPHRSILFIPDIDSWEEWDEAGTRIEAAVATVDVAYVDATFYADGEIPGRDMSGFPHPFIVHSIERLGRLPAKERTKIRFLHMNHTNPALRSDSEARQMIEAAGFRVAEEGERVGL